MILCSGFKVYTTLDIMKSLLNVWNSRIFMLIWHKISRYIVCDAQMMQLEGWIMFTHRCTSFLSISGQSASQHCVKDNRSLLSLCYGWNVISVFNLKHVKHNKDSEDKIKTFVALILESSYISLIIEYFLRSRYLTYTHKTDR